mmetsp:Transcript_26543/g.60657  ORF Transcript_26543/g.60657 Transcript_26543/m.60657 type:complete len:459 (-) Transcript_26543:206-1582(-)
MVRAAACNRACLPDACADAPRRAVHRARRRTRRDGTPPGFRRDGHARAAVLPRRACRGGHARRRARSRAGRCVRALVRTMHLARRGVDRDPGDRRERGPRRLQGWPRAARRDVRRAERARDDRRGCVRLVRERRRSEEGTDDWRSRVPWLHVAARRDVRGREHPRVDRRLRVPWLPRGAGRGIAWDVAEDRRRGVSRLFTAPRRDVRRAERAHGDRNAGVLRLQRAAEHRTADWGAGARQVYVRRVHVARARDAADVAHDDMRGRVLVVLPVAARRVPVVVEDDRPIRIRALRGIAGRGVLGIPGDDRLARVRELREAGVRGVALVAARDRRMCVFGMLHTRLRHLRDAEYAPGGRHVRILHVRVVVGGGSGERDGDTRSRVRDVHAPRVRAPGHRWSARADRNPCILAMHGAAGRGVSAVVGVDRRARILCMPGPVRRDVRRAGFPRGDRRACLRRV